MPAGVAPASLGDMIEGTIADLPRGQYSNTLLNTDTPIARLFFTDAKEDSSGGKQYETRIRVRQGSSFRFILPYQSTPNNQVDLMADLTSPWAFWEAKSHYNELEQAMNSGAAKLFDTVEERQDGAYEEIYNGMEGSAIQAPINTSDNLNLRGLAYAFSPRAAAVVDTTGGFNGTTVVFRDASTSTTKYGQDTSLVANQRLRNWVATHTGSMNAQTIETIKIAMTRTKFKSMPNISDKSRRKGGSMVLAMGHAFADEYERLVNQGPDDKNGDVYPFTSDNIKLRGVPVVRVPTFDSFAYGTDSTLANPVYGINTKNIYGVVLKGKWMSKHKPINSRDDVRTWTVVTDGSGLIHAQNLREAGFVVHTNR